MSASQPNKLLEVSTHTWLFGVSGFMTPRADDFHPQPCVCDVPSSDPKTAPKPPLLLGEVGAEVQMDAEQG